MSGRRFEGRRVAAAVAAVSAVLGAACSPPESSDRATRGDDELIVTPVDDGVFCDGTARPAAVIAGAEPGETLEFTSPMPIDVPDATADETGRFELTWRCDELESELTWDITATGAESGRSHRFTIAGSDRDPVLDLILIYDPDPTELVCDGTTRQVGRLSNAVPHERVEFTSPDSRSISPTPAGPDGRLDVVWTCSPDQDGEDWRITATAPDSGRTTEFTISGRAPEPADPGAIVVEMVEDPFVCDRGRRPVARLSNLTPNVAVDLTVVPADDPLASTTARADGSLTLFWQCDRRDEGTNWELNVTESAPTARTATLTFGSTTLASPVTIEITEDPFVCDGATRPFAVLRNFVAREAVDFESSQSGAIRQGRADETGSLPVRWTCDAGQIGTVWEITATGMTSGAALTFTITGVAP